LPLSNEIFQASAVLGKDGKDLPAVSTRQASCAHARGQHPGGRQVVKKVYGHLRAFEKANFTVI
jgi:hypothetical protein